MQPTCRHVPPRNPSFSITRVLRPHCDARMAVTYPPGPLPIIAKSYAGKSDLRPFVATALGWRAFSSKDGADADRAPRSARSYRATTPDNHADTRQTSDSSNGPEGSQLRSHAGPVG